MSTYDCAKSIELCQKARALKKEKLWDAAANVFLEQKALYGDSWEDVELAKLLQRAGRFNEAMCEIEWLLSRAQKQSNAPGWSFLPISVRQQKEYKKKINIHKTAVLICKREKRRDLQAHHEERMNFFEGKAQSISVTAEQDWELKKSKASPNIIFPSQTEEHQLNREATRLKKAGDIDGAIDALYERKALMAIEYRDDKLAKYLQAAGRFDEAMEEIDWLLETCQAYCLAMFAHQPTSVIQSQRCHHMAKIHAAAVLICKREKRPDMQAQHETQKNKYQTLREKLQPIAKNDQAQLRNRYETAPQNDKPQVVEYVELTPVQRQQRSHEFFQRASSCPFDPLQSLCEGDIDGARIALQKISYMVHAEGERKPEQLRQFTELMKMFVWIDPLFWSNLRCITPIINASPGIKQTALYKHMPVDTETARYVLYFADAAKFIVRKKKGNTYMVYLPSHSIPEELPKPTRRKRIK